MNKLACVVLAAGQSKRMKSDLTKVMHRIAGQPIIEYVLRAVKCAGAKKICVVTSKEQKGLNEYLTSQNLKVAFQKKPLGTANAVISSKDALKDFSGYVLIVCADVPLIDAAVLKSFVRHVREKKTLLGVLTMQVKEPGPYGRIIRDLDGRIIRIVEAKDAVDRELEIEEVNTGIFCVEKDWLFKSLGKIEPKNAQNEYYVTDLISIAIAEGRSIATHMAPDSNNFIGINNRVELSLASEKMRERINKFHQMRGVGVLDFRHTYIDVDVSIGQDTEIWPNTFLLGNTKIGSGCVIENGVVLKDAVIGDDVHIKGYTVVEKSRVKAQAQIGPFSRIRPESNIGKGVRLGNFVEVKKAQICDGAKANHLAYLGDATIGECTNIGCGTITCNYDGKAKHRTVIGPHSFIGSDTQFIAPVKIGSGATIGAGSTITKNVPSDALALSRTDQIVIKNWKKKKRHYK